MKLTWVATCAVGLIGCANKSGTLTSAEASSAGKALATEVEDGAGGFGTVSQGATATPSCVTLSGDVTDPDLDTIPNHATLTFNCTATNLGVTAAVTGTEDVTDDQPNSVAWAFTAMANLHGSITAGTGSITTDRAGSITATQGSAVGPFNLARSLAVTTVLAGAHGSVTVDVNNDWTLSYMPQASWTPGGVVVTGSLSATGSWNVSVGNHTADWTLATPTPLTLSPSCATRVTAGTVTGSYQDATTMHTVTVTWAGCGASTVTAI